MVVFLIAVVIIPIVYTITWRQATIYKHQSSTNSRTGFSGYISLPFNNSGGDPCTQNYWVNPGQGEAWTAEEQQFQFNFAFGSSPIHSASKGLPASFPAPTDAQPSACPGLIKEYTPGSYVGSHGLLTAWCFPSAVTPTQWKMDMVCHLNLRGAFLESKGLFRAPPNTVNLRHVAQIFGECQDPTLVVRIGDDQLTYKQDDVFAFGYTTSVNLHYDVNTVQESQQAVDYPSSVFSYQLTAFAYVACTNTTEDASPFVVQAPFSLLWYPDTQPPWVVAATSPILSSEGVVNSIRLQGTVAIRGQFQIFVKALNGLMWCLAALVLLSVACLFPTTWTIDSERDTAMNILAFSGALLFAIPTMRSLWPAAPAAGTAFDISAVFGQLLVVGCSCGLLMIRILLWQFFAQ